MFPSEVDDTTCQNSAKTTNTQLSFRLSNTAPGHCPMTQAVTRLGLLHDNGCALEGRVLALSERVNRTISAMQ